jgi:tRNA threonylcarbamoyladenosine biosynthesis protein TsaB
VNVLGFDTATPATAVAVLRADGELLEARHDPRPGERPGHATRLLPLVEEALAAAGLVPAGVDRVAVGVGPGSFTGLRIGVATARALAQATGAQLVGVSTLRALAAGAAGADPGPAAAAAARPSSPVLAVLDARRGEAFAAAYAAAELLLPPAALAPDALARALDSLPGPPLAVGDGAIRFRASLEPAGATVPPDGDPLHRISARHTCRLGAEAEPGPPAAVRPEYLRLPDAEARVRQRTP